MSWCGNSIYNLTDIVAVGQPNSNILLCLSYIFICSLIIVLGWFSKDLIKNFKKNGHFINKQYSEEK